MIICCSNPGRVYGWRGVEKADEGKTFDDIGKKKPKAKDWDHFQYKGNMKKNDLIRFGNPNDPEIFNTRTTINVFMRIRFVQLLMRIRFY